jgi:hypothetical protein
VDQGVDSLVAVDIRAWFLKELGVDVPTLKILGGGSIAELIKTALDKMPELLGGGVAGGAQKDDSDSEDLPRIAVLRGASLETSDTPSSSSASRSPNFTPAPPSSDSASTVSNEETGFDKLDVDPQNETVAVENLKT